MVNRGPNHVPERFQWRMWSKKVEMLWAVIVCLWVSEDLLQSQIFNLSLPTVFVTT